MQKQVTCKKTRNTQRSKKENEQCKRKQKIKYEFTPLNDVTSVPAQTIQTYTQKEKACSQKNKKGPKSRTAIAKKKKIPPSIHPPRPNPKPHMSCCFAERHSLRKCHHPPSPQVNLPLNPTRLNHNLNESTFRHLRGKLANIFKEPNSSLSFFFFLLGFFVADLQFQFYAHALR